jgi:YD repeat-containing protein
LNAGQFKLNTWYVLMLGTDTTDLVRLWERDAAPIEDYARRYQANQVAEGKNWRFRAWSQSGTTFVDTYSELWLEAETETKLDATQTASWSRTSPGGNPLLGLQSYWLRPAYQKTLRFGADAEFTGTLVESGYDGYGNQTTAVQKAWNGSSFVAYRATQRLFYPTDNATLYLVGLPGREGVFACPGGTCDYGDADVQSLRWLLYDANNWYNLAPTAGKLTRTRTFVCYANNSNVCVGHGGSWTRKLFSDGGLSYDAYGNVLTTTGYDGYGYQQGSTLLFASTGARTTTYSYADGGRNTYKTSEANALGQTLTWGYDYRLGVPTSETDANSIVTTAEYDPFGRLTKIIRPGDSSASPTVAIGYIHPGAANNHPFILDLYQKHSGGSYNLRKVYDGLGNLLQTQIGNASVNGVSRDLIVDYAYNGYGQVTKQSMPYAIAAWGGTGNPFRGQQLASNVTTTSYDGFGRVDLVQSPTTAEVTDYSYPTELQTRVCDGLNHCTTTTQDLWGRVTEVRPALDPWLKYSYDEADRLLGVAQRTGTGTGTLFAATSLAYDQAGRKTNMADPDLGSWSYSYDAQGNLTSQTDARLCQTTLTYDLLNRVTQKSYTALTGGSCGAATSAVTYGYDAYTAGSNLGRGKRTAMSDGSGSTTWSYGDSRGRLTRESKTISGGGSFVTQWAYDSADGVTSMTYPDGEVVDYSYLPQQVVNSVIGSATYVQASRYDVAGRLTERRLGADQLRTGYTYFGWTTQGGTAGSAQNRHAG